MSRKAVVLAVLVLMTVTAVPSISHSAYITLDPTAPELARLMQKGGSTGIIEFEFSAGGFFLESNDGELNTYVLSDRDVTIDGNSQVIGGLVQLPWGWSGELVVVGGEAVPYSLESGAGEPVSLAGGPDVDWAVLGETAVMRDVTVAPLTIQPVKQLDDGSIWMVTRLDLEVLADQPLADVTPVPPVRPVSNAFWPVYESLLLNELDELGLRLADRKGSLLIVGFDLYLNEMTDFIEWKKQLGYNVILYDFAQGQAPSFGELKIIIEDYYQTLDPPLEYVLLAGDENRGEAIDSDRITNPSDPGESDVTDWPLAFIEGDDYFPEIFLGRMTVGSVTEALSASRRVVYYERDPDLDNDVFWQRINLVHGNLSENPVPPLTPILSGQWLRERLINDWGFNASNIDTLFWRIGGYQPSPDDVAASINAGGIWVTYRGWGDSNGWQAPTFFSVHVDNLTNSSTLPVVISCVCNTGDFGNLTNSKCFAEHWITAGTPNSPTGAVAVIAPSDLHTKTKFNNPILSGFFIGVYDEQMRNISQALLRGKWEVYMGHPADRNTGESVEFYYSVYHLFGDPTMDMWSRRPNEFQVTVESQIQYGQDYLDVYVENNSMGLWYSHVQLCQDDNYFTGGFTDQEGTISLDMSQAEPGEVEVIITRRNFAPQFHTVQVVQQDQHVGVSDWSQPVVLPGNQIDLTVTLTNNGIGTQNGVTTTLTHPDESLVTIGTSEAPFGDIASGGSADNSGAPFTFTLLEPVPDRASIEFELEISGSEGGPWTGKIWVPVGLAVLDYESYDVSAGTYGPGDIATLSISFTNHGSSAADDVTAVLETSGLGIEVIGGTANLGDVSSGETVSGSFEISIGEGTYRGRMINYEATFRSGGNTIGTTAFGIPLEGAVSTDPLGPDSHWYFCYDNTDTGFENAGDVVPAFHWYDLESRGSDMELLGDDEVFYLELPFDFKFYGETYPTGTTITVNTNGFIEFFDAPNYHRLWFRNWQIPGTLGGRAMIAGFWDDLKPPEGLDTRIFHEYIEEEDVFVIEWRSFNRYLLDSEQYPADFEIVLFDESVYPTLTGDGIIEVHYNNIANVDSDNNGATVGIQNEKHTIGLEYTYALIYPDAAAEIVNGQAIRFCTLQPDNFHPIAEGDAETLPERFTLYGNYPNPFNSFTEIRFDLVSPGIVRLSIYNVLGREVAVLIDRSMEPGSYSLNFDAGSYGLSSGLYFVHLEAGQNNALSKMVYMK